VPNEHAMRIGVYSSSTNGGFDRTHTLVVHGRDSVAAAEVEEYVARAPSATRSPLSIEALATSKEYATLIVDSQRARTIAAQKWADAHGFKLVSTSGTANSGNGSHPTHCIVLSPEHSIQATGAQASTRNAYYVYDNHIDPSTSNGGVMLYKGAIGGYSLYRADKHNNGEGFSSYAFDNATPTRRVHAFMAHSGHYNDDNSGGGGGGRIYALHAKSSADIAKAVQGRVAWDGPVSTYNPLADQKYYGDDARTIEVLSAQGSPPGGPIERTDLRLVCVQLPGIILFYFIYLFYFI